VNNKDIADKAVRVVLSCETVDQAIAADRYANLTYRRISKTIGGINDTKLSTRLAAAFGVLVGRGVLSAEDFNIN
jgi:hypothetical protein